MSKRTDFSFAMNIAKSATADTGNLVIRGVASGTLRDRQGHKFSVKGLEAIKKSIEDGLVDQDTGEWSPIPLRSGHRTEWEDVLGYVTKSWIDPDNNLWIEADLDEDSSKAQDLYRKLSKGKVKLGLSVRGQVTDYHYDFDPEIKKAGVFFDNLLTKEISVTSQPIYPMPYPIAIAKSLTSDPQYQEGLEEFMSNIDVEKAGEDYVSLPARENDKAENNENVKEKVEEKQEEGVVDDNASENQESNPRAEASAEVVRGLVGNQQAEEEQPVQSNVADEGNNTANGEAKAKVAEEVNNDNNKADYVAAPNYESTEQEASQQEQSDAVADPAQNDDASLRGAVSEIATAVGTLAEAVKNLQEQVDEVKKSETQEVQEVTSNPVEVKKSDPDTQLSSDELKAQIASAVKATFDELGLTKIVQDVEVMKSAVSDLSDQPIDKSISVQKAKDEQDDNDPLVRYRRLLEDGQDPILAATNAGFNRK